ncbi:Antitoxin [Frankia sp. AiPs1]|uniref:antitoxin n=1 Tax=Frankia sp. AiPa1 TaxID=573492 RepID=UPI00202AD82B|nr:antitoxin [Frankia sp. AiPa1]MCL9761292.1 antitoxin [Frankia sp. AiPa1]
MVDFKGAFDKLGDLAEKHDDKIDNAVDKLGDVIDDRTDHKHTEHIDRVVREVQDRT